MNDLFTLVDNVTFTSRPDAVPYNYRTSYKIGQICLILARTCGRKGCSALKMHMLSRAMMFPEEMNEISKYIEGGSGEFLSIRFDPVVNRVINFCLADDIVSQQTNGLYRLTEKGKGLFSAIDIEQDLMSREKDLLNAIGNNLTEDLIMELRSRWRYKDAANKSDLD